MPPSRDGEAKTCWIAQHSKATPPGDVTAPVVREMVTVMIN